MLRAGAVADPAGREGLASMTAGMLDEGAGGKDALALADAVDFLGATLGASASWDASTVSSPSAATSPRPRSPCATCVTTESRSDFV